VSVLKAINPDEYHIVVISPQNYFLFTPLLPSATVGTLEPRYLSFELLIRSLVEPIRKMTMASRAHFIEAEAKDVDMSNKMVQVCQTNETGDSQEFYVPYDKLVVAVGSTTNTHGVDGLEHCHFLKTIVDARGIRNHIMDNFEQACLPTTTEEERSKLLSFVIAGGGPTGVEFASELYDMMQEDLAPYVHIPEMIDVVPLALEEKGFCAHRPIDLTYPQHLRRKNQQIRRK
jgi:NADH:ubiquinone reductase (H+-translocating)